MKKVLYLGNKIFAYKGIKSVMETLEPLLRDFCKIRTASGFENQILRLGDMLYHFFRYGLRADIIILDVYATRAFYFAFVLGALSSIFGKKYILFLHGGNLPSRFYQSTKSVTWLFSRAYQIIAPSPYLAEFFKSKGFTVIVIPNIIPLEDYPFKERRDIKPSIMAIRGFGRPYNPLMTLEAIHFLKEKVPALKLLMLGNPDEYYYSEVHGFVQDHSLVNQVEIRSKMPKKHWIDLSREYDIMVSNPIVDNTPVSLIEGMALGMCVISAKVGGVPHLVSDNECIMIDSGDSEALSKAILYLMNNPEHANRISRNGRERAEQFDWSMVKDQWKKVLEA